VVVVPARDERERLSGCLTALSRAADRLDLPVHVVVVLDGCTDGSEEVLRRHPRVHAVVGRGPTGVGHARRLGARVALDRVAPDRDGVPTDRIWLASTDADSTVPPAWLQHQGSLADHGADLVLGTVALDVEHPPWSAWYREKVLADGSHSHVHGANLGVRASTYLAAGGWPGVLADEDVQLTLAAAALPGTRVVTTSAHPVMTSSRLTARAPSGLASDLRRLTHVPPLTWSENVH
jgi:glycosyltransferase involved in cell wall biosynthesis